MLTIKPYGMLVKVGEQIRGLVPPIHLADILIKNPEKKYHIGDEVKCRVSFLKGLLGVLARWEESIAFQLKFLPFSTE